MSYTAAAATCTTRVAVVGESDDAAYQTPQKDLVRQIPRLPNQSNGYVCSCAHVAACYLPDKSSQTFEEAVKAEVSSSLGAPKAPGLENLVHHGAAASVGGILIKVRVTENDYYCYPANRDPG